MMAHWWCRTVPQNKVQHRDKYFTLLGFTALTGEPVLCVIIIAGIQQKLNVESGIDSFVTNTFGNVTDSDSDNFDMNFDPGKFFSGASTYRFLDKDIPCMVRWTPKWSITSDHC